VNTAGAIAGISLHGTVAAQRLSMPSGARKTSARQRRLAVVFPGEPVDRVLTAPPSWLKSRLVADASACSGSDVRRALTGRAMLGTAVVQPALVALQLVGWQRLLERGATPHLVAGHGAGEIAAWAASGAIREYDALRIAALRGAAVELAGLVHPVTRRSSPGGWNAIAMAPAREVISSAAAAAPRMMRHVPQVESACGSVLAEDEAPDLGVGLVEPPAWRAMLDAFLRHGITDVAVLLPSRSVRNILEDAMLAISIHSAETDEDLERITLALEPPREEAKAG
jgi:hypothetical protein